MFSNQYKDWKSELVAIDEYFKRDYSISAIQQHISYEVRNQNEIIQKSHINISSDIINGITESTKEICGTLSNGFSYLAETNTKGFNQISSDLNQIDDSINQLGNILHWGFSETIEQIRTSNILLGNIGVLLKIPDTQKESEAHIREGMKFFKNAMFNRKRYSDALENFLLAEKNAKTNYYLLQKIGLIYLYSKDHLNIKLSLQYFLKAADYSLDETYDNSAKTINYLNYDVSQSFKNQASTILNIKTQTSYSFLFAARCYYILKDYHSAVKYASKAYNLTPSLLEAGYDKAKYLSVINEVDKSIAILDIIINKDKFITLKVLNDVDLIGKKKVQDFLKTIKTNAKNELIKKLSEFSNEIQTPKLRDILKSVNNYLLKEDYLNFRTGLAILSSKHNFYIPKLIPIDKRRYLYHQKYLDVYTSPLNLYQYETYTKNIKDKLLKYNNLHNDLISKNKSLESNQKAFESISNHNKDKSASALMGLILILVPLAALYFIFTLNGIGGIILWLIFLGYPLVVIALNGFGFITNAFDLKYNKESQVKNIVASEKTVLDNNKLEMNRLKRELETLDLEKLEQIL